MTLNLLFSELWNHLKLVDTLSPFSLCCMSNRKPQAMSPHCCHPLFHTGAFRHFCGDGCVAETAVEFCTKPDY